MRKELVMIIDKIKKLEPLTDSEKQDFIRYSITTHSDNGKLADFMSISTSCLDCTGCKKRHDNPEFICYTCYAIRELMRKKNLREKMHVNGLFYTHYTIKAVNVPLINASCFRFESLGEIENTTQFINYCTIAAQNPHCYFVLWSKEYKTIAKEIKAGVHKPDNMRIIASAYKVNPVNFISVLKQYPFVDKIFCVFTKEYAKENNITISCGGKACRDCMICYDPENKTQVINELKK